MTRDRFVVARSVLATFSHTDEMPAPLAAPRSWFEINDTMTAAYAAGKMNPLTIALDGPHAGRVWADCAPKGQCLLDGRPGCWTVPAETEDDLALSMNGVYETAEGDTISVGVIAMDLPHAPDGTALEAGAFMAHTGQIVALVKYIHTPTSIAACGVIAPGLTYGHVVRARAAAQSGDWRALITEINFDDGRPMRYAFTGSICVNVPGLPLAVRLASARNPSSAPPFGPAIVIPQEVPMTTLEIPTSHTAGEIFRLVPRPPFVMGDEVIFAAGARSGRVLDLGEDQTGGIVVQVQEALPDGALADLEEPITVPISECVGTGRMFDREGWTDGQTINTSVPDVVVASAPACTCQAHIAADMGGAPAAPTVDDPTNDIMLERLDAAEKTIATLNERLDTVEASVSMSNEAQQVAAALSGL